MWNRNYYTYIMTNEKNNVLYTGVTNDLLRRVSEHKSGLKKGFTSKYKCNKLVWYEHYSDINDAIRREKKIKGGSREKKLSLIREMNSEWNDLFEEMMKDYK